MHPQIVGGRDALFTPSPPLCRDKQAALLRELERTKAELQDSQLKREKVSWCLADIADSKLRLQELADCLRASLEKEVDQGYRGVRGGKKMNGQQGQHPDTALCPPEGR